MKLFIDTASLEEIQQFYSWGIAGGVTTNPSLLKKAVDALVRQGKRIDIATYIKQILATARGTPVSLEVTEFTYDGMVEQGKKLFRMFNPVANNVLIKIPVNPSFDENPSMDGIRAIKTLTRIGIPINCTLVFTPEQALLAAKAGARIVSPFAGRIDDFIREMNRVPFKKEDYFPAFGWHAGGRTLEDNGIISGIELVREIVEIFRRYNIKSQVLAASMRNPRQVREAALVGADIATIPFDVISKLVSHYKTIEGMHNFTRDAPAEYTNLTKK